MTGTVELTVLLWRPLREWLPTAIENAILIQVGGWRSAAGRLGPGQGSGFVGELPGGRCTG